MEKDVSILSHNILMKDAFSLGMDQGGLRGEMIFGTGRKQVKFTDPFGRPSYYTTFKKILYRKKNIIVIGGYQFAFNKMFNIAMDTESTLRVGHLNDEAPQMKIGVHRGEYVSTKYDAEVSTSDSGVSINPGVNISALNHIFGFMMGDGGAKEDNMTALATDYKRRTLFHAVPFRMSNDGSKMPEGKYYGKAATYSDGSSDPIYSYYIKKFDQPAPHIVHAWVSDNVHELNVVDDSVYSSTSSTPIESYVEICMSVDDMDGRGYFTSTNSIPRINEFGLVAGWYNREKMDYEAITMFSHFTRPSISMGVNDSIEAIYRVYAR